MAVTSRSAGPDRKAVEEELRRLTGSPGLQHAESLCQLLRYLVDHGLDRPHEHLKEYQIAVDLFGRADDFDPRLDSTIRVQTSRLRNKLSEYYATIGAADPLVIEIPRGSYSPLFRQQPAVPAPPSAVLPVPVTPPTARPRSSRWKIVAAVFAGLLAGLVAGILIARSDVGRRFTGSPADRAELRPFWNSVFRSSEPPLVIFSNAEFVGRPETGLRYFDAKKDSRDHIEDLYTGIGEALAIADLADVFRRLGRDAVYKRSALLTWDETRNRDLIFAGSPTENLSLRDLALSQEVVFRPMTQGEPRPGDLAIVNQHPRPGEPRFFFASPTMPLTEDYAVVTLQPGLHPGQSVLLLAGTTTLGTQAAADFVSQTENLATLRQRLGIARGQAWGPFCAVLHVQVARGVPVESRIVLVRSFRGKL